MMVIMPVPPINPLWFHRKAIGVANSEETHWPEAQSCGLEDCSFFLTAITSQRRSLRDWRVRDFQRSCGLCALRKRSDRWHCRSEETHPSSPWH